MGTLSRVRSIKRSVKEKEERKIENKILNTNDTLNVCAASEVENEIFLKV